MRSRSMIGTENTDMMANAIADFWGCDDLSYAYSGTFKEEIGSSLQRFILGVDSFS